MQGTLETVVCDNFGLNNYCSICSSAPNGLKIPEVVLCIVGENEKNNVISVLQQHLVSLTPTIRVPEGSFSHPCWCVAAEHRDFFVSGLALTAHRTRPSSLSRPVPERDDFIE